MDQRAPQKPPLLDRLDEALVSNKRWLLLLLGAAFLLKLVYVVQSRGGLSITVPIMDSKYYDQEAREIAAGGVVRWTAFFMGPLYSYFLALVYTVFGRDFTIVRIIQIAGATLTIALTYLLGKRLFRPSAAFAGVAMLALYGATTFHEGEMLMMWLGTLINTSALFVLYRNRERTGYFRYAVAGFLIGLSALARANVLMFLPVVIVWALFLSREDRRLRNALVTAACAAIAVAPATIHNYLASRDFVLITSNGGVNFYIGNGEEATGFFYPATGITFETETGSRSHLERLVGREMKPSEVSRYWFDKSFDFIKEHPGRELRLLLKKTAVFFNGYEVPQIESYEIARAKYPLLKLLFVNFWMIVSLGLLGMLSTLRDWRKHFLLYGFVFSYAVSIILFFVTARYRIQVAPVMCLFAGHALVVVLPRMLRRARGNVVPIAGFLLLVFLTRPALFAFPAKELEWREHIHEARRLSEVGRRAEALSEISRAVELYPQVAESYVQRAIVYKEAGNYFKAIDDYSKAVRILPDVASVRYDLAQTLRRVKMYGPAIEEYEKAIELDPVKVEAYNNLGITYMEMGNLGKAIEYFDRVIRLDPKYIKAYNNLGAALAQEGDTGRAIAVLEDALRVDPLYANSYKNLSMVYVQLGKPREAYEYLSRYSDLRPEDEEAAETLAKLRIAVEADTAETGASQSREGEAASGRSEPGPDTSGEPK
jgi:Flp pilus assembly protein TadD/4-amino-4-deoxy-L-arabinose transferase-like glycosyltransferase